MLARTSETQQPIDQSKLFRLIEELNQTDKTNPSSLVHEYFHQQALLFPHQNALTFHAENGSCTKFSYSELDRSSNQLAAALIDQTGKKTRIGVSISRSPNLIIAILAIFKAGATFVPLDTKAGESLDHKIINASIGFVLTDDQTEHLFTTKGLKTLNLQNPLVVEKLKTYDDGFTPAALEVNDIAYIVYTSGTTSGQPSGYELTHGGFANLLYALEDEKIQPHTKVICTALPTFDAFLFDLLVAIATAGELDLTFEKGRYSLEVIEKAIQKENINYGVFLPDLLTNLDPKLPLKHFITMGAIPNAENIKKWLEQDPERRIENGFGLTETGICLTLHRFSLTADPTIIGKPIRNMKMFILNPTTLTECGLDEDGEIFIAGPGVAARYLGSSAKTAEKFLLLNHDAANRRFIPYSEDAVGTTYRLFASGDYGSYSLSNDQIVIKFIGRKDRQLKIDGVRIDLDAIEVTIQQHSLVKEVAVIPNATSSTILAFVVPNQPVAREVFEAQIQAHLTKTSLPTIAIPRNYCLIDKLPITANGKINTRALLELPIAQPALPEETPLSPLHINLRRIWAEVLEMNEDTVNLNLTFEQMGGNSLRATKLEIKINQLGIFNQRIGFDLLTKDMTINSLEASLKLFLKPQRSLLPLPTSSQTFHGAFFKPKTPSTIIPAISPKPCQ